ncbi:MAG: biopolymer transporter ExbD [Deltaproteobacteria bacterium]|nr:biopolymer transporter ExbD [Deltaproteobacteria bacterium]
MAGVSVGGGGRGGRKSLDSEINMIPMIDLLMVTISFLLITAVWVQSSRMEANANVPGPATSPPCETEPGGCKKEPRLHVETKDPSKFVLVWREGSTVVRSTEVPRESALRVGEGKQIAFPQLAAKVEGEWKAAGAHRDQSDPRFDQAVIHTSNDMPYGEIIAVLDAVARPKRDARSKGGTTKLPAFETTFAID